jgi:hypothetical protein
VLPERSGVGAAVLSSFMTKEKSLANAAGMKLLT